MKIHCVNSNSPFKSCKKHLKQCWAKKRKTLAINNDNFCRKYIAWVINEIQGG